MFSKLPIVPVKQPEIAEKTTLLKNPQKFSALSYLKEDEDYQKSGYCSSVLLRTGIVRFAFFKLFGTGIVALISACRALNGKVAYSCALSAAVNAVASFHYYFIWSTRRQELPPSYKHMAFKLGGAAGPTEKDTIQRKILLQEYLVDGWRFSDWAITLPLMQLELWLLAESVNPTKNGKPQVLDANWCAALQPAIIALGSIVRFYMNSLKPKKGQGKLLWYLIGYILWFSAAALFVFTTFQLHYRMVKDDDITEDARPDYVIICLVLFVQIGYGVMSLFEILWLNCVELGGGLSITKDLVYGVLDTVTKGGLAIYVAARAVSIPNNSYVEI